MYKNKLFLFFLILLSCFHSEEAVVNGRILFDGKPVYDCEISVFLKEEKDKTVPPVKVVATDENGVFSIKLKRGVYYLNARKRHNQDGEVIMLVGDTRKIEVQRDINLGDWNLHSKKDSKNFEKGTGIEGRVVNFTDYSKVRIYIYDNTKTQLRGPDYVREAKINPDGSFKIDLPSGKYYLAVREREKRLAGPLSEKDKTGYYEKNPFSVEKGMYVKLGEIRLTNVDIKKLQKVNESGIIGDGIIITGNVFIKDKKLNKKIYILAYENQEMIGKPVSISTADEQGNFKILLPKEGKYYIGARSRLGGPVEPGEYIGAYTGSSDRSIYVSKGKEIKIKIEVNEVW
ncbi:MAG: DUF4198 domain-containing protein [Proteobacteria bacterium]|nr:DUF4198 domain-containing protein [Pseudomonadota bacterium]